VIQFFDIAPLRTAVSQRWQTTSGVQLSSAAPWRDLGRMHRHLVVLPAWQCSHADTPGGEFGYATFGQLAVDNRMTINSFYASRYSDAQIKFFCSDQALQIERDGMRGDTAYVITDKMIPWLLSVDVGKLYCRNADQYVLCSREAGRSGVDASIFQAIPVVRSGASIATSTRDSVSNLFGWGWSGSEPSGRWTDGQRASMLFRLPDRPHRAVRLKLSAVPFTPPAQPRQRVSVTANGVGLLEQAWDGPVALDLVIPNNLVGEDGMIRLDFEMPDAVSPRSLKLSPDPRVLGIRLTRLTIEDSGN
jgi:hypothetical protein